MKELPVVLKGYLRCALGVLTREQLLRVKKHIEGGRLLVGHRQISSFFGWDGSGCLATTAYYDEIPLNCSIATADLEELYRKMSFASGVYDSLCLAMQEVKEPKALLPLVEELLREVQ